MPREEEKMYREKKNTFLIFSMIFLIGIFSGCIEGEKTSETVATEAPTMTTPATQPATEEQRIETTPIDESEESYQQIELVTPIKKIVDNAALPTCSPDGKLLAYHTPAFSGTKELFIYNIENGDKYKLTEGGGSQYWSPTSDQIVYYYDGDVWIINKDGTGKARLTSTPEFDRPDGWSKDGRYIYFGSERSGEWKNYLMDISGENIQECGYLTGNGIDIWCSNAEDIKLKLRIRDFKEEIGLVIGYNGSMIKEVVQVGNETREFYKQEREEVVLKDVKSGEIIKVLDKYYGQDGFVWCGNDKIAFQITDKVAEKMEVLEIDGKKHYSPQKSNSSIYLMVLQISESDKR